MKPVDQLNQIHQPDGNQIGDCFRACVASILELDPLQVPHFVDRPSDEWIPRLRAWLTPRGLGYIVFDYAYWNDPAHAEVIPWVPRDEAPAWVILGGPSPRGAWGHHCVGQWSRKGITVVHDPQATRAGLPDGIEDFGLFILLDPVRAMGSRIEDFGRSLAEGA